MTGAVSLQTPQDVANDYATLVFVIQQLLNRVATVTLVKVVSCTNDGGVSPFGFVNVIPLVNQMAGSNRQAVPHGTLYRLPYFRLQGGTNAVILDPQPDDIGLAAFCMRDISAVKSDPAAAVANANAGKGGANPGSQRQFNMADGLYIGGFLNGTPAQYVQFNADGITLHSPTKVRVEAPAVEVAGSTSVLVQSPSITLDGPVHVTGAVTGDSTAVFTGNVTGQGTSLHTHIHSGVQTGGGNSGPPV